LSCSPEGYSGPAEPLTVGIGTQEASIPIIIAEDQQFFALNGLNVTLNTIETGPQQINGVLNNELDFGGTVAEFVLGVQAMNKIPIKTIGCFDRLDYVVIIGRKDHGITVVSQLVGKKIGVIHGTALDFYLGHFLELQGLNVTQVTLVDFPSSTQMVDAIVNGDVDAIICAPPYSDDALGKLGTNAVSWKAQSGQMIYVLVIGKDEWIKEHPDTIVRFLKAMRQTEEFIVQHPENAKSIAKKKLSLSDDEVSKIWARNLFSLSLEQSLILAMEDEARWMMHNNLITERQMPDFREYIYVDALKAVKPEAVNIR
jgi:NitT/TauT family transport system substrate-binding protein